MTGKSIHFILPGGGVKGCFQAGFLYRLRKSYHHLYQIYRIDGTSVGSLNGAAMATDGMNKLREIWFSIKRMEDLFHPGSSWSLKLLIDGLSNRGIYENQKLWEKIVLDGQKGNLSCYNCVVTDINDGMSYYINGSHPKIKEYILASSSPWIITRPQEIDGHQYTDGGLLENFPISYCENSKADLKVLVGYDSLYEDLKSDGGENLFTYLQSLIDISRRDHYRQVIREIERLNVIKIPYGLQTDFLNFNQDIIRNGWMLGELAADEFAEKYLDDRQKMVTFYSDSV